MNSQRLCSALTALLFLPALAFAAERIRVFDDEVLLAIQGTAHPLSALPIGAAAHLGQEIGSCSTYIDAGLPSVDGMLPAQVRTCQINALIRIARPSTSSDHPCDALAALADGLHFGGFNSVMNQRWNLPKGEHRLAAELAEIEILPGCTGLSIVIDDWTIHFILRAIADWNLDAQPDYLLELIEVAHMGSYRASQLLVAVSKEQQWLITTPVDLLKTNSAPSLRLN